MRTVSLFNSLSGLDSFIRASQFAESPFGPAVRLASESQTTLRFPIDARETDAAYIVHANLPGVSKEQVHIEVDGAHVKISANSVIDESKTEGKTPSETLVRRERVTGQFERQFKLAQEIDAEGVIAKLELGVLEVTLPKKVQTSAKKILVQ
jgi:HSP20 family protein